MQLSGGDAWKMGLAGRSLQSCTARSRQISQAQAVLKATVLAGKGEKFPLIYSI